MTLLLVLACASVSESTDRQRYLRAASLTDLQEAAGECEAVSAPSLEAECTSFAAARAAADGDLAGALTACATLGLPWSQECAFLAADAAEVTGEEAMAACSQAGRLGFQCLAHAADRHCRQRTDLPLHTGQEAALLLAIEDTSRLYLGAWPGAEVSAVSRGIASRLIARRWRAAPFHPGLCGEAEASLCVLSYRASIQPWLLETDGRVLCEGGPPSESAVEAAGLSGWEDGAQAIPSQVWRLVCQDLSSREVGVLPPWPG